MLIFALTASQAIGDAIASHLGVELAKHEERDFSDGEHKARPLQSVRDEDVYVVQSLHGDPAQSVNDRLCRLLFYIATLRDQGARRITAVVPYFAYARKDRRTKSRDPVTSRYIAEMFEAMGVDAVMTLEIHNIVAFQNAFRCATWHLDLREKFSDLLLSTANESSLVVASPDPGGVKRAQLYREHLETVCGHPVGSALIEKRRSAGVVSGDLFAGDVEGATVAIIDDMICSGNTLLRAAGSCKQAGAKSIVVFAAHGLFQPDATALLESPDIDRVIVSDSTDPASRLPRLALDRVQIVSAATVFASAIRHTQN